jgi:hypothetical protein
LFLLLGNCPTSFADSIPVRDQVGSATDIVMETSGRENKQIGWNDNRFSKSASGRDPHAMSFGSAPARATASRSFGL